MAKQYLYQHQQHILYGWNEVTADLVRRGHCPDLHIAEENDPRIQDLIPKTSAAVEPKRLTRSAKAALPELPASVLEQTEAKE